MDALSGRLESVNVGAVREVPLGARVVTTGIWKAPVAGRVPVAGVNLRGDDQADRTVHGGPDKAVYAYAGEDADWWLAQPGPPRGTAPFGENLTTRGLDLTNALIGERWAVGSALLEVCQPRVPCFKLGLRHDDPQMVRRFAQARRPGAYLRILGEGDVGAGDIVEVVHRPAHGVTVGQVSDVILGHRVGATELRAAPELPQDLLGWLVSREAR